MGRDLGEAVGDIKRVRNGGERQDGNAGTFVKVAVAVITVIMRGWIWVIFKFLLASVVYAAFAAVIGTCGLTWFLGHRVALDTPLRRHLDALGRKGKDTEGFLKPVGKRKDDGEGRKETVLLTGGTGFVGGIVLRDLLRNQERLGIGRILCLVREKKGKKGMERLEKMEVLEDLDLSIVECVEGDVQAKDMGFSEPQLSLLNSAGITKTVHCAASVSFTQSMEEASSANILPALKLKRMTSKWGARYVHISTAFVHGDNVSSPGGRLGEDLHDMRDRWDVKKVLRSMREGGGMAEEVMRKEKFANTYCFSKCIAEIMLMEEGGDTVIIRPAVVGPSVSTPYMGYGGERASTLVAGALLFLSSRVSTWHLPDNEVPVVPCDVVGREVLRRAFGEDNGIWNAMWGDQDEGKGFTWKKFSETTVLIGQVKGGYGRWVGMVTNFLGTDLGSQGDGGGLEWWHKNVPLRLLELRCKLLECVGRGEEVAKIRRGERGSELPNTIIR